MVPHPQRSGRPGFAGAPLDTVAGLAPDHCRRVARESYQAGRAVF
jgi:hypothetical protein